MAKKITPENKRLFEKANRYLVGGVDSPVRSFSYVGGDPILIKEGKGANVYDYDGKRYIDYVLSWGAIILGHAHPSVIKDLKHAVKAGLGFGTTNKIETELARAIHDAIGFVEKIRFVNSGTEAVMGAIRLARGYTDRDKILKFENSYHGHADYLLVKGGSGLATLGIPSSAGVPDDFVRNTIIAPQRDAECVENIFKKSGHGIAAVIIEPVGGNYGVIPPNFSYLKKIRLITKRYGTLLIFDEIITGFRFGFGSIAQRSGIVPDLICLGKIIGGGLPIGAYGGSEKVMGKLAPLGDVYQASTFAGNPIVMQAGLSTINILKGLRNDYSKLEALTELLSSGLEEEAESHGVGLEISRYGNMFSLKFEAIDEFKKFYRLMLEKGIYFAPSEFESNFLSFAHTRRDIEKTIYLASNAFKKI